MLNVVVSRPCSHHLFSFRDVHWLFLLLKTEECREKQKKEKMRMIRDTKDNAEKTLRVMERKECLIPLVWDLEVVYHKLSH